MKLVSLFKISDMHPQTRLDRNRCLGRKIQALVLNNQTEEKGLPCPLINASPNVHQLARQTTYSVLMYSKLYLESVSPPSRPLHQTLPRCTAVGKIFQPFLDLCTLGVPFPLLAQAPNRGGPQALQCRE
jgi:hypothetical protein